MARRPKGQAFCVNDGDIKSMLLRRSILHIFVWLGVFTFWLLTTRQFHPTLGIAILATAVLVLVSAIAVYINRLFLLPRFAHRRLWWQYLLSLSAVVIILDLIAVPLIQTIYDWLWKPDPLRFGFWFNMISDGFIIIIHLIIAMGINGGKKLLRGRIQPQPSKS